jgi:hypothetical protein
MSWIILIIQESGSFLGRRYDADVRLISQGLKKRKANCESSEHDARV